MADKPPAEIGLKADQGSRLVVSMIALIVLPTVFVMARLISRRISHAGYYYDDLLVSIACALCYIPCICVLVSERHNGFGRHINTLPNRREGTRIFLKILYVYEVGWFVSALTVKLAILAFYRRIFPVQQMKLPLLVTLGFVLSISTGSILTAIFQCTPIHKFWNLEQPGHCINPDNFLVVSGSINCILYFFIVILPIPLLWRLRTTTTQKEVLTGIFLCAGFACIISIVRLVVLSRLSNPDVTWNYVNSAIWSVAEPCMGVISACIPSLRPGFSIMLRGTTKALGVKVGKGSATGASSGSSEMWSGRTRETDSAGDFQRLDDLADGNRGQWGHGVAVKGGQPIGGRGVEDEISLEEMNVPAGGIRVKKEVMVTSSDWLEYRDKVF